MKTELYEESDETVEDITAEGVLTAFPGLPAGFVQDAADRLKNNPKDKGRFLAMEKHFGELVDKGDVNADAMYAALTGNNKKGY